MPASFRWASPLGIAVSLFLVVGAVHLLIGILTPFLFDPTAGGSMFLSHRTDTALYGAEPRALLVGDPVLVQLRSTLVMALAGVLVGLGIVELALAWFGVRSGQAWALAALVVAGLGMVPYWMLVLRPYLALGVSVGLGDVPPFMSIPTIMVLPGLISGALGLARLRRSP